MTDDLKYMNLALKEALKAKKIDEVPIGAVIVKAGEVIASSYNHKETEGIATAHAEILAINEACKLLGTWHLEDCCLYTTIEPCMMCTGAIIQARLKRVVYGAANDSFGYLQKAAPKKVEIISGVLEEEAKKIMSDFFKQKRTINSENL